MHLQPTESDLIRQNSFALERTRHELDAVCLWEQPAEISLRYPGLLPFAVLGQSADAEATLRQVAQTVDQISGPTMQANLTAASEILAGIRLEEEVIYRLLRRSIMQESVIHRSIQREAEARAETRKQRFKTALNLPETGAYILYVDRRRWWVNPGRAHFKCKWKFPDLAI